MAPASQPTPAGPRSCHAADGDGRAHVIDAPLFRRVVTREGRRADRSNQPFVLLLVSVRDGRGAGAAGIWAAAIAAVAAAKRETDILGWLERQSVLGVILTEIRASDLTRACERLETRVRGQLAARIDGDTLGRLTVRLHVHTKPCRADRHDACPVEPLLDRERGAHPARRPVYDTLKRALDVLGSLTLLALLSPLLVLIAVLVKAKSRGPILYRQARIGQRMKPFTMLKFRTMTVNADHKLHHDFVSSFINNAGGAAAAPGTNGVFKLTNDPRVTPVGRMLRKTSLDELPQLWNVLRGDMSLVGPRPALAYELEQYKPWHRRRILEAKPGVTGLWQVAGRSRTTFDEMVRMDLRYVRRRSLWTDVKILLATPKAVVFGKGAC